MRLAIEKIVFPGRRLSSAGGKVVFTDEGLPGEIVEAVALKEKKNFIEARTTAVLKPSDRRLDPRCSHYRVCSPYQPLPYDDQVRIKRQQLREILASLGPGPEDGPDFVAAVEPWHYRNKLRLHVVWEGTNAQLAYNEPGSETLFVPVTACHLASAAVNGLLGAARELIGRHRIRSLREIEAKESRASGELLLSLFWSGLPDAGGLNAMIAGLASAFPLAGIISFRPSKGRMLESAEWGRDHILDRVGETRFALGAASFFQVHAAMLERVLADVRALPGITDVRRAADLYCGIGTFGLSLANRAGEVYGVESDPANIAFLKQNIGLNGITNFKIFEGRSEEWAPLILEKGLDVVIVDPPRKGLGPKIVGALLRTPPETLVYLSCNPTTLARDLRALEPRFCIRTIRGYDFFPQTPHIETLAVLGKKGAAGVTAAG